MGGCALLIVAGLLGLIVVRVLRWVASAAPPPVLSAHVHDTVHIIVHIVFGSVSFTTGQLYTGASAVALFALAIAAIGLFLLFPSPNAADSAAQPTSRPPGVS